MVLLHHPRERIQVNRLVMIVLILVLLAFAGWHGYNEYRVHYASRSEPEPVFDNTQTWTRPAASESRTSKNTPRAETDAGNQVSARPAVSESRTSTSTYHCDGRTRCSQMTSCAEATYFLKNCPGVQMDGDRDGIPCESQWCGH